MLRQKNFQEMNKKFLIVIPSYRPTIMLFKVIDSIYKNILLYKMINHNNIYILVIDYGNRSIYEEKIINDLNYFKNLIILKNSVNMGQGYSIKKGITYAKENKFDGILTLDDDGQHTLDDIINLLLEAQKNENDFIIGVREFNISTPLRSKIGNYITSFLIKILFKIDIPDVTSGLRFYRSNLFNKLIIIKHNRFDFQLISLIISCESVKEKYKYIFIETIYISKNKDSRFNPFTDSFSIIVAILEFYFKKLIIKFF